MRLTLSLAVLLSAAAAAVLPAAAHSPAPMDLSRSDPGLHLARASAKSVARTGACGDEAKIRRSGKKSYCGKKKKRDRRYLEPAWAP